MSNWWKNTNVIPLENQAFRQIIKFYLFECPVVAVTKNKKTKEIRKKHVSARGIPLEQHGWSGPALNSLLAAMKRVATSEMKYISVNTESDLGEVVANEEKNSVLKSPHFELIAFKENADLGKAKSILYMIRNAFAHGSFSVENIDGQHIYCLESAKDGSLKARMRLREETLLEWMKLVEMPVGDVKTYQTKSRKRQKDGIAL